MLIALTGAARSGKDTAGQYLCTAFGFTQYAFADPIRAALSAAFGLTAWHFNEGKEIAISDYGKSPRQLMQHFGTEFGRGYVHPDIWLMVAEKMAADLKDVVITDCRFNNEAEWVRDRGGYVIRISRSNAPQVTAHVSEQGISETLVDFEVENNGTLLDLFKTLDAIYTECRWARKAS